MQAATLEAPQPTDAVHFDPDRLCAVVLTRIASAPKGLPRTAVADDLAALVSHRLSPVQWRQRLDAALDDLARQGSVTVAGAKLECTESGRTRVAESLGLKAVVSQSWPELRDTRLVARALGLEKEAAKRIAALAKPEGLRAAILLRTYRLKIRGAATPARLRAALASIALDRAFGNRARDGFGGKLGLSAKAGRLLAGQLAGKPRDFSTDARLVAALAAECIGASKPGLAFLQQAVLRKFLEREAGTAQVAVARSTPVAPVRPKVAESPVPQRPEALPAALRPDLAGFGRVVRTFAVKDAQGWSGSRKAYISHIWRRMREEHANWGLSEIEFKCMLAEAHRAGHVVLANADLKDAKSLKDVQESAVVYKNAVFHFVRVEA